MNNTINSFILWFVKMRSDPNALELLLKVVDWVTSKNIPDWKFFTAVLEMLINAAMTNRNKGKGQGTIYLAVI